MQAWNDYMSSSTVYKYLYSALLVREKSKYVLQMDLWIPHDQWRHRTDRGAKAGSPIQGRQVTMGYLC